MRAVLDDAIQSVAAALSVAACLRARRRARDAADSRAAHGWLAIAAGLTMWLFGQQIWTVQDAGFGPASPVSLADVGFLSAVVINVLGLLLVAFPCMRLMGLLRTATDGLIIVGALLLTSYVLVLQEIVQSSHASRVDIGISLAYPTGDLLLVTVAVLALTRAGQPLRTTLGLVTLAMVGLSTSDSYFAVATLRGTYTTGGLFDVGWVAGFALLGVAAASYRAGAPSEVSPEERRSRLQVAAPYSLLLLAIVVTALYFVGGGETDNFIRWTAIATMVVAGLSLVVFGEYERKAEALRAHLARHDALTGLPNIIVVEERLNSLLASGRPVDVAYANVNRMRTVNSGLGHVAGDELLREIGGRVRASLPESCLVGRAIGDEFVAISPAPGQLAAAALQEALREPITVLGQSRHVTASIGTTSSVAADHHADELLRRAHAAMVRAKAAGPARMETFDPDEDHPATPDDLALENALRTALYDGSGLLSYFQPIVSLRDDCVVGHEALVRWAHPSQGLLAPAAFLGAAQSTGLVAGLGWWMLDACVRQLAASPSSSPWVAVNVSGSQLGRGELVPALERVLAAHQLRPCQLHLEITESELVTASRRVRQELRDVTALGVMIALDDFGTGYSSLSFLRDLPVHMVKVDQSFVHPLGRDAHTEAIVAGLLRLCNDLGLMTVAEGIETPQQRQLLQELGCEHGQGYLLGRPAAEFARRTLPRPQGVAVYTLGG